MRPLALVLLGIAALSLASVLSGCSGPTGPRPYRIEGGELAAAADELDARVQSLQDAAYGLQQAEAPDSGLGSRVLAEVDQLRTLCGQLRGTIRSISLFPEPNSQVQLFRLNSDASALAQQGAALRDRGDALAAIAADARTAGLAAGADGIDGSAALLRRDGGRVEATAEVLRQRAGRLAGSMGVRLD